MSKVRVLRFSLYVAAILSLAISVVASSKPLMHRATADFDLSGDLFRMAKVRDFWAPMPPAKATGLSDLGVIANGTALAIGDSFFEVSRGCPRFATQLGEVARIPIYLSSPGHFEQPLRVLRRLKITNDQLKLVLLESAERLLEQRFIDPIDPDPPPDVKAVLPEGKDLDAWFVTDKRYEFLLRNNVLTRPLHEAVNTALFHWVGSISSDTPVYSLNPPMLFYTEEAKRDPRVATRFPTRTDELVERLATNVSGLCDVLRARYGLELVFMPIPDKLTVYRQFVRIGPYDDFIPRLLNALERRGIKTIRLYEEFRSSSEMLYFPSDTHWNCRGMNVAVQKAKAKLKEYGML